jgi:hypothetical protein
MKSAKLEQYQQFSFQAEYQTEYQTIGSNNEAQFMNLIELIIKSLVTKLLKLLKLLKLAK